MKTPIELAWTRRRYPHCHNIAALNARTAEWFRRHGKPMEDRTVPDLPTGGELEEQFRALPGDDEVQI